MHSVPSPERILAGGGHIAPADTSVAGLDVDLIVRDHAAGENHWQTFATSRHDLLRASKTLQGLDGLTPPQGKRTTLVLPAANVEAAPMRVLLQALDDEAHPTADNSVAVASLVHYFNPTEKSRWNRLQRDCRAAFEAAPLTADNWLERLDALTLAPSDAVEGWADRIAHHVASQPALRRASLACNAQQMQLLLQSRALSLREVERLDWALDFAKQHRQPGEAPGAYLARTQLNAAIRWVDLPTDRVHSAWRDQALTEAQFIGVMGALKAAGEGYTLTTLPFGRLAAVGEDGRTPRVTVHHDRAAKTFSAELTIPNFPKAWQGTTLKGPTFDAAGGVWRIDVYLGGIGLRLVSGPAVAGQLRAGVFDPSQDRWFDSPRYARNTYVRRTWHSSPAKWYAPWKDIAYSLTLQDLKVPVGRWLGPNHKLLARVSLLLD